MNDIQRQIEIADNYLEAVEKIRKSIEELKQQCLQLEVNTIDLLDSVNGKLNKAIGEHDYLKQLEEEQKLHRITK